MTSLWANSNKPLNWIKPMKSIISGTLALIVSFSMTQAAEPAWWGQKGVKSSAPASNKSPANLGQLKWVAKQAKLEFDSKFASYGGAGVAITQLVNGFQAGQLNYSPANQGQLKAIAKLYYDRLLFLGFDTRQSLRNHGVPSWGYFYSWTSESTDDSHFSPALLGQLKWTFSFDLTGFSPNPSYLGSGPDSDGDGLADWAENLLGTNPNQIDTDGDGISDWQEIYNSVNTTYNPIDAIDPLSKDSTAVSLNVISIR